MQGVFEGIPKEVIRTNIMPRVDHGVGRKLACTNWYFYGIVNACKGLWERFAEGEAMYKKCWMEVKKLEGLFTWGFCMRVWLVTRFYGGEEYLYNSKYFERMEGYVRKDRELLERKSIREVAFFNEERFWKGESVIEKCLSEEGELWKMIKGDRLKRFELAVEAAENTYEKMMKLVKNRCLALVFLAAIMYVIGRLTMKLWGYLRWDFLWWVDDLVMVVIALKIMYEIFCRVELAF